MTRARILLLSITLPLAILSWPFLLLSCFIPLFGFLALPTVLSISLFILYGSTWLLYLVLGPTDAPLPYSPQRCYKVCSALARYIREAWRLGIVKIGMDWSYRRVMVLGSKGREAILRENIVYYAVPSEGRGGAAGEEEDAVRTLDVYLPPARKRRAGSTTGPVAAAGAGGDVSDSTDAEAGGSSKKKVPVVVFVPGGGWAYADKKYYLQLALTLRKKGLMVVVPNLTLYPEGNIRDMVEDLRRVLEWTGKNASRFGGNPDSIYLMGHGSGSHISLLSVVQEAVVRSRDAYWLSNFTGSRQRTGNNNSNKKKEQAQDEDSKSDSGNSTFDSRTEHHHHSTSGQGDIEISAGIRRLEIFGGEGIEVPPVKGVILMAGVGDVIKHIRMEFKNGIEQLSPLRRALGPSHASCLMASPSHLLYGAKQIIDTDFLPKNFLLVHGGMDREIPIIQTVLIRTLLQGIGIRNVSLKAYKDLSHMECITALCGARTSKYSGMLLGEIVNFIAGAEKAAALEQ